MSEDKVACRDCETVENVLTPVTRFFFRGQPSDNEVECLYEDFFFAAQGVGINSVDADSVKRLATSVPKKPKKLVELMQKWRIQHKDEVVAMPVPRPFAGTSEEAVAAGWKPVEHGGFVCPDCKAKREAEDPEDVEHGAVLDSEVAQALSGVFSQNIKQALEVLAEAVQISDNPDKSFGILVRGLAIMSFPRKKENL